MTASQEFNIGRSFARVAKSNPELEAVVAADLRLTYAKLWRITCGFAVKMQELSIDRTSTVAVHTTDMIVSLATMLAASLLGARYVALERRLYADNIVAPTHCIRSPEVQPFSGIDYMMIGADWALAAPAEIVSDECSLPGYADSSDPWWILHTSGTTGRPKYLIISQKTVYDRSLAVRKDFVPAVTRFCPIFPCFSRPFFVRATAALLNGCTIIDSIEVSFILAQRTNLVCGSPRATLEWLGGRTISPRIPVLQVSGNKLSDAGATELLRSFEVVEDVYGSSETNKSFVNEKRLDGERLITVGRPQDSDVEIVGDDGKPCSTGENGMVRIRNGYMANAYIAEPAASARAFRDGWFYPGDIGYWGNSGELVVNGRVDDLINLGGVKIDPLEVEAALKSADGISAAAVFADPVELTPPRLVAMITLSKGSSPDVCVAQAHSRCTENLGDARTPHIIYVVPQIPMNIDDTPNRSECRIMAKTFARPTIQAIPLGT